MTKRKQNRRRRQPPKANSRHAKAGLRRPRCGSIVIAIPSAHYHHNQFVQPYIGTPGKVIGYRKNYNSVVVKYPDGFTLGHHPSILNRA